MSAPNPTRVVSGGVAEFCVRHREVSWTALAAVLIWGVIAGTRLGQQEDPTIPHRTAMLTCVFPGATASKVEELVTKPLERKASELSALEEIKSQSRSGIATLTIKLQPASASAIEQEWERLRAKLREVALPAGAREPWLNTDFGNTMTLLFALVTPPISDAECVARANLIRDQLAEVRGSQPPTNRAAALAFFPPGVAGSYREFVRQRFETEIRAAGLASHVETRQGDSFILADLVTRARRTELEGFMGAFVRRVSGSDHEMQHPDFTTPILLMGNEDPLPRVRAAAPPRYSYRRLETLARDFEDQLKQLGTVGKVSRIGIVPETVYLLFSDANVTGYGLTPDAIREAIGARNAIIPGGTLRADGQNFPVQLSGEFRNEDEMLGAIVGLGKNGAPVYLRDLFEVRRMYESPIPFKVDVMRRERAGGALEVRRAVMVGVEMKEGRIIRSFEAEVRGVVARMQTRLPEGIEIQTLSDQPAAVAQRVAHFGRCLLEAVGIVIIVALFLMDWRAAMVVAAAIPLTLAMTAAGMHALNIPVHQISIAALIIALGMLVDDPVVASDAINRELHHGAGRERAAWLGPFRLRRAILFGTIINILAFLPLVLLPGDKGAFIYALPAVVTLALISSRIVSMTFIPLLGYYLLRGQRGLEDGGELRSAAIFRPVDLVLRGLLPRYRRLLERALRRPGWAIGLAYGLLAASLGIAPFLGKQFFPPAERSQLVVDIELPPTASLTSLRQRMDQAAAVLRQHEEIVSAALFTGGTAPRFYYNVAPKEPANHLAQILINTRSAEVVPGLVTKLREELDRNIPGARCTARQLEQGPPVEEPIQVRFRGENLDDLGKVAEAAAAELRRAGGYHVFDDLGVRMPTLEIHIDQDRANSLGLGNERIGLVAQAAFAGIKVTELREGDRLIPVVIRLRVEDRNEAEKIRSLYVQGAGHKAVPFDSFASIQVQPEFATIPHHDQLRTVTVRAYAPFGELPSQVLARARPGLSRLALPAGCQMELAGEHKELRQNQAEMGEVMLVSLALIAAAMVIQFNSVMKSLVVMLAVPLGLVGALMGLGVTGSPVGFTGLLGIVSLAGVIVSHIIVLSDFIEEARAEGMPLEQALVQAGLVRLRAVLVTVLATVGGLVPLFLTGGALWHPLTAVHIFGLLLATVLTLILLPVLYYVFCAKFKLVR